MTQIKKSLIDFTEITVVGTSSAVIGALIMPHIVHAFIGGLGMIAAAGAISAGLSLALGLTTWFIGKMIYESMPLEWQDQVTDFFNNHEFLKHFLVVSSVTGISVSGIFLTSLIMGQAFLPLLTIMGVGLGVIVAALGIYEMLSSKITDTKKNEPNSQEHVEAPHQEWTNAHQSESPKNKGFFNYRHENPFADYNHEDVEPNHIIPKHSAVYGAVRRAID